MRKEIRLLTKEDFNLYKSMQTGLKEDYMLNLFPGLTDSGSRLFGLFINDQLVSTAGYTVFANHHVMLGRLRSDHRFRGQNYGTELLKYVMDQALALPSIEFVGANTQSSNHPAQKVLKKINMAHLATLYEGQTQDLSALIQSQDSSHKPLTWTQVEDSGRKREWIKRTYLNEDFPESIFPFEAYYPFPVSESLFKDEVFDSWKFYENEDQTRYFILWEEDKGNHYLHVTYPWSDFMKQSGFWKTIDSQLSITRKKEPNTLIWIDLSEEKIKTLPETHPFNLSFSWMLYGIFNTSDNPEEAPDSLTTDLSQAYKSLEFLEKELKELEDDLNNKIVKTENLKQSLDELNQ